MTASIVATFALIVTTFYPMDAELARANVIVLDHGLTPEECMKKLREHTPDEYGTQSILSCSFDYDF